MRDQDGDYVAFRDSVIVALADDQEPPGLGTVELSDLCKRHGITFYDSWIMTVGTDIEALGWGTDQSTLKQRLFLINGSGLARAAEIRRERAPKTVIQKLTGDTSQKLINVLNFGVALLALVVAAIALIKA